MVIPKSPDYPAFEITGGALCLDLANTVNQRPTTAAEGLRTYEDLVGWAEQAGVLTAAEGQALREEAARRPADAAAALSVVRELREALHGTFAAQARGALAPTDALAMINTALPPALARLEIHPADGGYTWSWRRAGDQLDSMLAPVIDSAADLLTSPDLIRVRECESAACGWLFLDRSRNRSRRWCDMTVCGNRAKVRRHYQRSKQRTNK